MTLRKAWVCFGILALAALADRTAHAERWVQVDPGNELLWYDVDSVRPAANGFITVWMSAGPTRTVSGPNGKTTYPTYSVIDCRARTAGSKFSFDLGEALQSFEPSSAMGELIVKLCSFQNTKG